MTDSTFNHVLTTLMRLTTNSATYQCLSKDKILSVYDIIVLNKTVLRNLFYDEVDYNGVIIKENVKIPLFHQHLLLLVGDFFHLIQHQHPDNKLDVPDILATTRLEWDIR
jgi:hypothetical protein